MADVTKLHAARQPPIPLKPFVEYHQHYPTTRVTTQFVVQTSTGTASKTVTCKQDLPFAPDASDNECLIQALKDFKEACLEPVRLNIKDETMHKKAFDIIGVNLFVIWKAILQTAEDKISKSFVTNTHAFIAKIPPSNTFLIQQEILIFATKPFSMNCFVTAKADFVSSTLLASISLVPTTRN